MPRTRPPVAVLRSPIHANPVGQTVLVLQGGGALGAYQVGVYQALHEAGMSPDWVIGTSIGAVNAALVVGNAPDARLARLDAFWSRMAQSPPVPPSLDWLGVGPLITNAATVSRGIAGFFAPRPSAWGGPQARVGVDEASYYTTEPLRETLAELIDLPQLQRSDTRLTVGAVHVASGQMRYFDSRREPLGIDHIMASGALPPAFAAVRIQGEAYWDGGLYSNTPIEAVLDDHPRRSALIFAVNVWQPAGPEPASIHDVMARQKDIQYASRDGSHIARQQQIHKLRHVIRQLQSQLPASLQRDPQVQALTDWGCGTTMHVARLLAPPLAGEDSAKDIDFSAAGIAARRAAGYADTQAMLAHAPWQAPVDPMDGVVVHDLPRKQA